MLAQSKGYVDLVVPGAGLEPAQPQWSQDFKSCVSTIPPSGQTFCSITKIQQIRCYLQAMHLKYIND